MKRRPPLMVFSGWRLTRLWRGEYLLTGPRRTRSIIVVTWELKGEYYKSPVIQADWPEGIEERIKAEVERVIKVDLLRTAERK